MTENNSFAHEPHACNQRQRCPHCTALSRLTHSLLDTRHGNTVHIYQCIACGKRVWDDGQQLLGRLQ